MVAIHHRPGSYSDKWIEYCQKEEVDFIIINLFDTNLINTLREKKVTHLLFHFGVSEYKNELILKDLCHLLEKEGIKVFPNHSTYWHYDDKVKQKYLFEQLNIPHVPMHVFYSEAKALSWIEKEATYPFVFKLRRGAGSNNVKLIENKLKARKLVKRMFNGGINSVPPILKDVKTKVEKHNRKKDWRQTIYRLPKTLVNIYTKRRQILFEKGYFLAQDFVDGLDRDYRLKIVGDKCWGLIRYTRDNDFRASGSGRVEYDHRKIPIELVKLSFELANKLEMQSIAFDFLYSTKQTLLIEVSYCYGIDEEQLSGYWTSDLKYHAGYFRPEDLIIENLLRS